MFIVMNRFKVIKEESKAFEDLWVMRESHLGEVKGFQAFHLLRGPEREDHDSVNLGSNPGPPARQSGLRGIISRFVRIADIPAA
jgi:Antibiotic biosynthesis monooxygenase